MLRSSIVTLSVLLAVGTAKADDVRPMAGKSFELKEATGAVYYTREAKGFRVVATVTGGEGTAPLRFVTLLADGQGVTLSVPVSAGEQPQDIEILRTGDTLSVVGPQRPEVRASLD